MNKGPHAPPLRGSRGLAGRGAAGVSASSPVRACAGRPGAAGLSPEGADPAWGGPAPDRASVDAVIARVKSVYGRWRRDTPVAQMRADWDALFNATGDAAFEPVTASGVPCAWVTAPGARSDRVIVYFHGGGFQVGSLASHRELMSRLSAEAGVRVLGVDYRLAPEHRHPAPLQDALAVLDWLQLQGCAAQHIALAGDSAGGGLALSALLARQGEDAMPAAAFVMSAWTDLAATGESYETRAASDPIHQRPMIQAMARNFLGKEGDARDPLASPLYASDEQLAHLPPLLLQVGDHETVLSDSVAFAARVNAAGGRAECQAWPGMVHVFQQFPNELPQARDALRLGGQFLAAELGLVPNGDPSA